jgi:hypothetical protein
MTGTISVVGQIAVAEMEDFVEDRSESGVALRGLEQSSNRLIQVCKLNLVCSLRSTAVQM